jgi:hypothetical protein
MDNIDINFDVYTDTPKGKDPDSYSNTLRNYNKLLWSKQLPCGTIFDLSDDLPRLLHHKSELGEFILSSDSIGHTYSRIKRTSAIVNQFPQNEINEFFKLCSTIGAYIIFPAYKIENQMTINGARGLHSKIVDRFDLTLECIRRYYLNINSPLSNVLIRYSDFFKLFGDFKGYVDFFLLQDLIKVETNEINFFLPFEDFASNPVPNTQEDYAIYKRNLINFVTMRNKRILNFSL